MSSLGLLALLALGAGGSPAAEVPRAPALPSANLEAKAYGILLLGDGDDEAWTQTAASVRSDLKGSIPFAFAEGPADARPMQKGVDELQAQGVKKIVAVPLFLTSFSDAMDQNRYLLGIREKPSEGFLRDPYGSPKGAAIMVGSQRVTSKVPVVLAKALDDHPLLIEILAARLQGERGDPAKSALILVGHPPAGKEAGRDWLNTAAALAEKVRQKAGFRAAKVASLSADAPQEAREKQRSGLRRLASELRRQGRVVVAPLDLTPSLLEPEIRKALDGLFVTISDKTVLPDARVSRWVVESAAAAAKLPDMRVFKPGARAVPRLAPPPSINAKGDNQ